MFINKYYNVLVGEYANKHFIKAFSKKYKTWNNTFIEINNILSRVNMFLLSSKISKIHICDIGYIAKCEFKIVGSNESAKTSGNRIIVFVDEQNFETKILLVYAKTDIKGHNETTWWEQEVKNNYKEIYELFSF